MMGNRFEITIDYRFTIGKAKPTSYRQGTHAFVKTKFQDFSRTFPGQMSNFQGLITTKFQDFSRIVKFLTCNKKQLFFFETADLGNWEEGFDFARS